MSEAVVAKRILVASCVGAARGNFNNQCTAFIVTFRLYALDRVGDPMKDR